MTVRTATVIATTLVVAAFVAVGAQTPGFKRTVVQQADLHPRRAAKSIQAVGEFQPGASPGRHTHAGEEVGYILEGLALAGAGRQAGGHREGRTGLRDPGRPGPQRDQHRHRRRQDPRHLHRRKRQAARHAGEVASSHHERHEKVLFRVFRVYRSSHARIVLVTNSGLVGLHEMPRRRHGGDRRDPFPRSPTCCSGPARAAPCPSTRG